MTFAMLQKHEINSSPCVYIPQWYGPQSAAQVPELQLYHSFLTEGGGGVSLSLNKWSHIPSQSMEDCSHTPATPPEYLLGFSLASTQSCARVAFQNDPRAVRFTEDEAKESRFTSTITVASFHLLAYVSNLTASEINT